MADLTSPPTRRPSWPAGDARPRRPIDGLIEPVLPREAAQLQALQVRQALASTEGRLSAQPPAVLQALFRVLQGGPS